MPPTLPTNSFINAIGASAMITVDGGQRILGTATASLRSSAAGGATGLAPFVCIGGVAQGIGIFGITCRRERRCR